jgi:hypothetical protein
MNSLPFRVNNAHIDGNSSAERSNGTVEQDVHYSGRIYLLKADSWRSQETYEHT